MYNILFVFYADVADVAVHREDFRSLPCSRARDLSHRNGSFFVIVLYIFIIYILNVWIDRSELNVFEYFE